MSAGREQITPEQRDELVRLFNEAQGYNSALEEIRMKMLAITDERDADVYACEEERIKADVLDYGHTADLIFSPVPRRTAEQNVRHTLKILGICVRKPKK